MSKKHIKQDMSAPRDRILMAAWDLFHQNGIDGTSVDDILTLSETGKSQFYHYFGSKEGLVHATLETARHMISNNMIEGCGTINSWDDFEASLSSYIDKMNDFQCQRVCPIGRFAIEVGAEDEATRKGLELIFEAKKRFLRDFLIKAQAQNEIHDDANIEEMVEFIHAAIQGSSILAKAYKSTDPMERVNRQIMTYLKSFRK